MTTMRATLVVVTEMMKSRFTNCHDGIKMEKRNMEILSRIESGIDCDRQRQIEGSQAPHPPPLSFPPSMICKRAEVKRKGSRRDGAAIEAKKGKVHI